MHRIDEEKLLVKILSVGEQIEHTFASYLKENGLSEPQYNVLRILRGANKPIPSQTIAERLISRRPDITRLVDRLNTMKLVKRKRCDKDRRVVYVSITEKGLSLLNNMDQPMQNRSKEFLADLSDNECNELMTLMNKLMKETQH